jgi:hypothetical protein
MAAGLPSAGAFDFGFLIFDFGLERFNPVSIERMKGS